MKSAFSVFGLSAIVLGLTLWTTAGTPTVDEVAPERLLPQRSILLMQFDGSARHLPAIKQTAAWKALEDTGIRARMFDLIETFVSAARGELVPTVRAAMDGLMENGISLGITISPDGQQFAPYGVLVLHQAADMQETLVGLAMQADRNLSEQVQERSEQGRSISFVQPGPPGVEVAWWSEGPHLVLTAGVMPVSHVLATLSGAEADVTNHPLWSKLRHSDECTIDHLCWLDSKSLLDQFGGLPFPEPPPGKSMSIREFVDMLGVAELESFTMNGGYKGAVTWNNAAIVAPGPRKGILKLLDQRNISFDELPPMPSNTDNFAAGAFDIKAAVDVLLETAQGFVGNLGEREQQQFQKGFDDFQQAIGGHPRDVFSAGLGDLFCVYNDPTSMPIPMGIGPVVVASVENRSTVESTLRRLFDLVRQMPDARELSIRESEKNGHTYFSFQFQGGVPIVPTIMVTDQWVVASLMPGAAQSFVARLDGKVKKWEPGTEVQQALAELPKQFTSISVSDPRPGYRSMMTWAPMALGMIESNVLPNISQGREPVQMPFGIQDLPSAEELTAPLFPNVTVSVTTEDGVQSKGRSSVPGIPVGNVGSAAVIPILVALLLPAVQQAREAARRTQSKNNLKQLGLAMHNYHAVWKKFPAGTVENEDLAVEERLSWVVSLLPYMEQAPLHDAIDRKSGWNSAPNKKFARMTIPTLQNPSQIRLSDAPGAMDYVAISGIGPDSAALPIADKKAGIFGYNRSTRIRDITDGTSNTLAITDSSEPNQSFMQGGKATIRGFSQQPYVNGPDGIGSPHAGGFQVLLADGSVRFVSENIDPTVLEALATMHGGEVIGNLP